MKNILKIFAVGLLLLILIIIFYAQTKIFINTFFSDWLRVSIGVFSCLLILTIPVTIVIWLPKKHFKSKIKYLLGIFLFIYSFLILLYIGLLYHKLAFLFSFDFFFFWNHRSIVIETLFGILNKPIQIFSIGLSFFIILFLLFYIFFQKIKSVKLFQNKKIKITILVIIFLQISLIPVNYYKGELFQFIGKIFTGSQQIEKTYEQLYFQYLDNQKQTFQNLNLETTKQNPVIFLHLESLNSNLISQQITPNFYNFAQQSIFIPKLYSNSVQTIRVEESVLCGLPPLIKENLEQRLTNLTIKPYCLPEIMNQNGYKTLFYKSHDITFADTNQFMTSIGFSELHSEDIMHENDTQNAWGYRDDIYYQRVFENLKNQPKKFFAYIAVSSTNHFPFAVPKNLPDEIQVPIKNPQNIIDNLKNTTYIQDYYIKQIITDLQSQFPDAYIFVFGDNPWPTSNHEGNFMNYANAYEENFLTSMFIITPEKTKMTTDKHVSHQNTMFTLLNFLGVEANYITKKSMFNNQPCCQINIQPFSSEFISITKYPLKYIFNISNKSLTIFDLKNDTFEFNPVENKKITDAEIKIIQDCFK